MAEVQQSLQRIESGVRVLDSKVEQVQDVSVQLRVDFNQHRVEDRQDFAQLRQTVEENRCAADDRSAKADGRQHEINVKIFEKLSTIETSSAKAAGSSVISSRLVWGLVGGLGVIATSLVSGYLAGVFHINL